MASVPPTEQLPLRERKKAMTRAAIAESARRLFAERGYADVTVAEIADAANVSAKTLFMYFRSKDDLYFDGEEALRDDILAAVQGRRPGEPALDAVERHLLEIVGQGAQTALQDLHDVVGAEPALQARLAAMWQSYEDALTELLAAETRARAEDPMPQLVAAQLIALYRVLATDRARRMAAARPSDPARALRAWVCASVRTLREGVGGYAPRA